MITKGIKPAIFISATGHCLNVDKPQTPVGFAQFSYCKSGKQRQPATTVPHATEKLVNKWNFKDSLCQRVQSRCNITQGSQGIANSGPVSGRNTIRSSTHQI